MKRGHIFIFSFISSKRRDITKENVFLNVFLLTRLVRSALERRRTVVFALMDC